MGLGPIQHLGKEEEPMGGGGAAMYRGHPLRVVMAERPFEKSIELQEVPVKRQNGLRRLRFAVLVVIRILREFP